MKPLKTSQRILIWLCMCSAEKSTSVRKSVTYFTIFLIIFAINFGNTISGYMYFIKYMSTDLEGCLFAFMASSATLVVLYTMFSAYRLRHKINELFENLAIICANDSKCSLLNFYWKPFSTFKLCFAFLDDDAVSIEILNEANNTSEFLCTICVMYLISTVLTTTLITAFIVMVCWFMNGHLDVTHLYHPLKLL